MVNKGRVCVGFFALVYKREIQTKLFKLYIGNST